MIMKILKKEWLWKFLKKGGSREKGGGGNEIHAPCACGFNWSKSIKVFRKIGWISSKFFDKVFDAGLHGQRTLSKKTLTKFLMENFDHVKGP